MLYYEAILLWQMPYAWLTFWVSDWGTRGSKKKKKRKKPAEPQLDVEDSRSGS